MARKPRNLQAGYTYHVMVRCNNRRFNLKKRSCRDVLLYALRRAKDRFGFKLYALCIMSNHVHYLLEPAVPDDLPRIMHWLNWYTAMCFNRMLNRTGHFWEERYHSTGFPNTDHQRVLRTLRYIHGNPKAAGMSQGFHYRYSNYRAYAGLTDDGLTEWHPAFLNLAQSLDACARAYRRYCRQYQLQEKEDKECAWGDDWLDHSGAWYVETPAQLPYFDQRYQVRRPQKPPDELVSVVEIFRKATSYWSDY